MDIIRLLGIELYGYHGVFASERELGQRFEVDVEMFLDLKQAGKSDDLDLTVNYADVYTIIKEIVEEREFNLIEALAEAISEEIMSSFSVEKVVVRVRKPHVGLGGLLKAVEVEIERTPSGLQDID
jgi:dihydroneopterin aldolase